MSRHRKTRLSCRQGTRQRAATRNSGFSPPRETGKFPGFGFHPGGKTGWHPLGGVGGIVDDEPHPSPARLRAAEARSIGGWGEHPVSAWCPLTVDQQRRAKPRSRLAF